MDRRASLKSIVLGSVAGSLAVHGCKPQEEQNLPEVVKTNTFDYGRTPKEKEYDEKLLSEQFFNEHEMATISALCNLILPSDEMYKGALDAEVPNFIEFMAKDLPELQPDLRGGLMWIDHKSNTDFDLEFKKASEDQQKSILDEIAYPDIDVPEEERPLEVNFFSLIRNLTITGFYTSKIGIEELGYKGNMPNVWDGVPEDVLEQHGITYDEEWLTKCVDQSKRGIIAQWDENGNLLT